MLTAVERRANSEQLIAGLFGGDPALLVAEVGHFAAEDGLGQEAGNARALEAEVLGSERLTGAALDRLTHRCHILETKGESYRLQDAKRRRRSP